MSQLAMTAIEKQKTELTFQAVSTQTLKRIERIVGLQKRSREKYPFYLLPFILLVPVMCRQSFSPAGTPQNAPRSLQRVKGQASLGQAGEASFVRAKGSGGHVPYSIH